MTTSTPQSTDNSGQVIFWLIGGVVLIAALYGWANERRDDTHREITPAQWKRFYRSQFSSEQERLEFEGYLQGQQELYGDAPTGHTRGGDRD